MEFGLVIYAAAVDDPYLPYIVFLKIKISFREYPS